MMILMQHESSPNTLKSNAEIPKKATQCQIEHRFFIVWALGMSNTFHKVVSELR